MNVITCYKIVPEEQDILVLPDHNLSFDRAEWKIGQYDLNAIEAGMQIVEVVGGKVSALSVGDKQLENSKLKKGVLSRGPQDLFLVVDDQFSTADSYDTARILQSAVAQMGDFDIILCGDGSSDLYAQQVGIQLGQLLNVSTVNAVSNITPAENKLIVERVLDNEVETLEISLPAVISVSTDINEPRIPGMKEILAAGKKPVTQWSLLDIGLHALSRPTEIISTLAPEQADRGQVILEGESEEIVEKLLESIRKAIL